MIPVLPYKTLRSLDVADLSDMMGLIKEVPDVHTEQWHYLYRGLRYLLGYDLYAPQNLTEEEKCRINLAIQTWKESKNGNNGFLKA